MEIEKEKAILAWLNNKLSFHREQRNFLSDHNFLVEQQAEHKVCVFIERTIQEIEMWEIMNQGANDD